MFLFRFWKLFAMEFLHMNKVFILSMIIIIFYLIESKQDIHVDCHRKHIPLNYEAKHR